MGQKIRQAMAERDANYKLAGLIEMDDTYFGAPKPGKRGRGAAGKAKAVVAVETPADKPRFAAMRIVPRVSSEEIQPLARERLATEAVIKTDGWQGYSFLDASPGLHHEWLLPDSGKEAPKVLPWVHTLPILKAISEVSTMASAPSICPVTWRNFVAFNFKHPLQGQHRNAAFLVPHQQDHPEPFVQRGSGLVKYGARGQRGLIAAGPAMV